MSSVVSISKDDGEQEARAGPRPSGRSEAGAISDLVLNSDYPAHRPDKGGRCDHGVRQAYLLLSSMFYSPLLDVPR